MRFWKVAPGRRAEKWNECHAGGYIAVGWDEMGDLTQFLDRNNFDAEFNEVYPDDSSAALWNYRDIAVGDIILANQGRNSIIGVGVVTSGYIPPQHPDNPRIDADYKHIYKVNWFDVEAGEIDNLAIMTCHPFRAYTEGKQIRYYGNENARLGTFLELAGLTDGFLIRMSNMAISNNLLNHRYKAILNGTLRNVILQGPPGTGKTYEAKELAARILGFSGAKDQQFIDARNDSWNIVQFHPAYQYDDFIHGIKPTIVDSHPVYEDKSGIFKELCERAPNNEKVVLIVDEINRAHLASVLGELIYGLEYRDESFQLSDGSSLCVPRNLYLIGTMNTADRSVGHIDYAVRRRFAFIPLLPEKQSVDTFYPIYANNNLRESAVYLFDVIEELFKPGESCALSPDFNSDDVQPGHTYFFAEDLEQLKNKFLFQVAPLLREYVKDGVLKADRALDLAGRRRSLKLSDINKLQNVRAWLDQVLPDNDVLEIDNNQAEGDAQ